MNSSSEHKNFSETSPRPLPERSMARGKLLSVLCRDGFAITGFKFGAVAFPEELHERLAGLVGKTVAILRLDGKYHVRAVD